ncbi:MAG: ribonuclease P [archaeon]|nr:MAG: ribonuclease P [archaeon]
MIPNWQRKIARERIRILLREAESEVRQHPERSRRYAELARKIGMRYKVRFPKKYKRKICKSCFSYLKPGVNCTVRLVPKERCVVWRCLECKKERRYPYAKK